VRGGNDAASSCACCWCICNLCHSAPETLQLAVQTHTHTNTHTHTLACSMHDAHTHIHIHANTQTLACSMHNAHVCTRAHTHTHTRTRTHTHTHTNTHIHTHTHTACSMHDAHTCTHRLYSVPCSLLHCLPLQHDSQWLVTLCRGSSRGGLLPRVLLVSLHAALGARDYTAALSTLHAYFDHVQVRRQWCMAVSLCVVFRARDFAAALSTLHAYLTTSRYSSGAWRCFCVLSLEHETSPQPSARCMRT